LLDWIEVRAICRQIKWNCAPSFDGPFDAIDLVKAHIVHEHNVAFPQSRSKELLDIGLECLAIHCAFAHEGRGDAVVTQRCDECKSFPVPVQHLLHQPLTLWRPAIETSDRRRNGGFIDEYELSRIKQPLPPSQRPTRGGDVWPILLSGLQTFF
jgi:hypothetical protein